jgi:CRISPR-associated protein Cas1
MTVSRTNRIVMDGNGAYLGMSKVCFVVKDKKGREKRYPLFENQIKEVVLKSGNAVSTGALASLGFWDIDVMITTHKGKPVAMLKSTDDESHVKTRLCQYEAYHDDKGLKIAKKIVLGKIQGQNHLLSKYGLEKHNFKHLETNINKIKTTKIEKIRKKLNPIEGRYTRLYFKQIFKLIPEELRPEKRKGYKAYDGMNNLFNLGYEVLQWKVHRALIKAKLEPYLGFLHSVQYGKPSLVCDLEELYRYLIDDFIIQYSQNLKPRDFTTKMEDASKNRKGRREYLKDKETREMMRELQDYFKKKIEIPVIRYGKKQRIETLLNEEALLLAKYIRNEKNNWIPRIAELN